MPDKPLTVFTYAASASLAAIALVYFFHPAYLIDGDGTSSSASSRKKGIVGLYNPANDCFINCVLQSLAGLGDLRVYMIRELHRRRLEGSEVYASVPSKDSTGKEINAQKLLSLQNGEVTEGLKDMLDKLNEKPIYRKTISANAFIRVLEHAFGTPVAKTQQDAQELLQFVAERLQEEYHAGCQARHRFREANIQQVRAQESEESGADQGDEHTASVGLQSYVGSVIKSVAKGETEDGFPLEGQTESRVECKFCGFIPKAKPTSFVMLNLMVPQTSSSTLNDCFDSHFKTEIIDDYNCDKCRLTHALEVYQKRLTEAKGSEGKAKLEKGVSKIQHALEEDPERPPEDVTLPESRFAPKRRIARHIEMKQFPKILIIHLSRSIFDPYSTSMKNLAKVTFPERLPVGGLVNRRIYRLSGLIIHKGTHNSGHYETVRRQGSYAPYSNPNASSASGPFSRKASANPTPRSSPSIRPTSAESALKETFDSASDINGQPGTSSSSSLPSATDSAPSTDPSSASDALEGRRNDAEESMPLSSEIGTPTSVPADKYLSPPSTAIHSRTSSLVEVSRLKRKKKPIDRWWRISDDKIKECKLSEVLGMTKGVYMLFYEMERSGTDGG
ncbi:uncharacterized protein KY384_000756 [Bacidia gigantensis]|uniref:uncharacterized protein n=1 Tax=Bacidia gigantensis TaxID=2732470 RepID=UPI001D03AAC2|nr:uncharacterized protein KY384_000756 [Bacidia gigantensis]KAG8525994.1 hypothetical protein KY384_000756 [Bacidia gigantensis]